MLNEWKLVSEKLLWKNIFTGTPPPATIGDPRTNEAIIIPLYYLIL